MAAAVPLLQLVPAAPASAEALQLTTYRDGPDEFELDIPEGLKHTICSSGAGITSIMRDQLVCAPCN